MPGTSQEVKTGLPIAANHHWAIPTSKLFTERKYRRENGNSISSGVTFTS